MGKLMKYELKSLMKFILSVLIVLLIASTILQYNIYNIAQNPNSLDQDSEMIKGLMIGLSFLVLWGSYLVSFFYIVNSYNKELTEDKGYLTFTLPVTGYEILGSKVLSALIYFIVLVASLLLYNSILGIFFLNKAGIDLSEMINGLLNINIGFLETRLILLFIVLGLLKTISTLIAVYFSMTLRKIVFGGKRMNGIWFIIFLVVSAIIGFITLRLALKFPYFLNPYTFEISTIPQFLTQYKSEFIDINITEIFMGLITTLVGFGITGYMLDEKIEI